MRVDYIHLRIQSSYSFLESALTIDKIVEIAYQHRMPAISLTDKGNLFGSLEFSVASAKKGIQAINGVIFNINYETSFLSEILLIAKDKIGYKNLLKLVNISYTKQDSRISYISFQDLLEHNDGLIVLSCYVDGIIGKYLIQKELILAFDYAAKIKSVFGDRFYFEIMRHGLNVENLIEDKYLEIAGKLKIPLVATNKVLFDNIKMHEAHDVLLCISAGVTKETEDRLRVSENCYFKSCNEMRSLFTDLPEALQNTIYLAQRCSFTAHTNAPILPSFSTHDVNENELLKKTSELGLLKRLEFKFTSENIAVDLRDIIKIKYFKRLNYELSIICSMNFAGYFLIVSDFITWSKEQGIVVGPGRGSGAGSIVAWSLLITDLDPLKFGLLFERFLNPERISMPDFDIDFCQERRDEVINYVRLKYGDSKVGQIVTFGKMQAKAVIKDVSRVLSLPYRYAEYLTELVPFNAVIPVSLNQALKDVQELRDASIGKGLYNLEGYEGLIKQVIDTSLILEGLHRHASTHAAGIVISSEDLVEFVPVYRDRSSNMLIVQYSMKYAEMSGLIKFDFLGLQTLTLITKCLSLLKDQGLKIDLSNIDFSDSNTYDMLCQGKTIGVFQFESIGMESALRRLRPDSIKDLIALGALYRPGPMDNIPTYIACKHGLKKPDYIHPMLKPILEDTYGVVIYQEQVLEIAQIISNYTLGAADILRRAMGKKIKSEMQKQEVIFVEGAIKNNISEEQARLIFATVAKFAGYGFNKAHATAYGVISYQTAYLKANFLFEFLVASLNLELNNHDKLNLFIQEAKSNKLLIMPPDINISKGFFALSILNNIKVISYGLGAIKNVTVNFGTLIELERSKNGDFKSIVDFVERVPLKNLNRKLLESLIKSGAFDKLHKNRYQLFLSISKLLSYASSYHTEKASNQFSFIQVSASSEELLVSGNLVSPLQISKYEFEVLGLFLTIHPMSVYAFFLESLNLINSLSLNSSSIVNGTSQIMIAGVVQKKDSRMSSRGRFVTLQLSDHLGIFELTIFSEEILKRYVHLINVYSIVIVSCDLLRDEGGIRLIGKDFFSIREFINFKELKIVLYLNNNRDLMALIEILLRCVKKNDDSYALKIVLLLETNLVKSPFVAKINLEQTFFFAEDDLGFLKSLVCCN